MIHFNFTPYRFKSALLSVLGAGILTAACSKTEPQHDTTYMFSRDEYSALENLDQIRRSADSTQVRNIIFKLDNRNIDNWGGVQMDALFILRLQPAFDTANGKGVGQGIFKQVYAWDQNIAMEPAYNALGYKFEYYIEEKQ